MSDGKDLPRPRGLTPKYAARLYGVPLAARLGRLLGKSWRELGELLGPEVLVEQVRRLDRGGDVSPAPDALDIVFLTMIGGHTHNASVDAVLALALQARGHRVRLVLCDQQLPVCEVKKAGQESEWSRLCAKCYGFGRAYFSSLGLDVVLVSDLVRDGTADPGVWDEVVEAALLKHFRVGILEETEKVRERRAMLRESASVSDRVGREIVAMEPDRVIMSHGIYTTWGPQFSLLRDAGIPVVTYSKGKKKTTETFNWNATGDWWGVEEEWERVEDVPLTDAQELRLDAYLATRRDHSADTLRYNRAGEEPVSVVRRDLDLDPDRATFALFTNVLWDAASAQREIAFQDPVEWVMETMDWFRSHPEKQLVVKIHPAERVIGTEQPFGSIIRDRFPTLPDNVRVIEPEDEINSWSVIKVADVGLVHTSTVGLELALEGVPCVLVSETHYRGKGFTVDIEDRERYFELLEGGASDRVDEERMVDLARRYAFLLFERYQLPFDYLHEVAHTDVRALNVRDVRSLVESPVMKLVVRSIEDRGDFLLDPEP